MSHPAPKSINVNKPNKPNKAKGSQKKTRVSKPPLTGEQRKKKLFNSLCSQIEGDHLANALKTTDKLILLDPTDDVALQTKLFLLLRTAKYQEALDLSASSSNSRAFDFERAYALYRLQREAEAASLLKETEATDDRGVLFLQAQINYRQGKYHEALEIYNSLLETSNPGLEEYSDIQTNIQATETHLEFLTSGFLTSIHSLPPLPNRQSLEDTPLPPLTSITNVTSATTSTDVNVEDKDKDHDKENKATGGAEPPKVKPPRKSRVPKGVIPGVTPPPDPERWLKKSERTRTEVGGKNKKKGATQGGGYNAGESTAKSGSSGAGGGGGGKKKKR